MASSDDFIHHLLFACLQLDVADARTHPACRDNGTSARMLRSSHGERKLGEDREGRDFRECSIHCIEHVRSIRGMHVRLSEVPSSSICCCANFVI